LRSAVRPAVDAALSSASVVASSSTSMPKSAMIWSAVRRRSLDLSGDSGLICASQHTLLCCVRVFIHLASS
jgi:hypothetical protein